MTTNTQNPKRPERRQFKKQTSNLTRHQKQMIALELIPGVIKKLDGKFVPDQVRQEMKNQIAKFKKHKPRFHWKCLFKLYIVSDYPTQELQHWIMTGKDVYRKKNAHLHKTTTHTRRPSIYDPHGNVIPRQFIDKHLPEWIKSQREYDRYMQDKRGHERKQKITDHKQRQQEYTR